MKALPLLFLTLIMTTSSLAQYPVFSQNELWTMPYEDLSDLLRRFPGLYPQDYGTLGAPIVFRPWNMNPWLAQVDRDGIPQNRRVDGLFDSNLQPAGELESIEYLPLSRHPLGTIALETRSIPLDSPYTEFQIREGYYGYGTVDFAHGQRAYRTITMELTGRLSWYNGMRLGSASRFNRVRGRIGFDIGDKWCAQATYGGSNVDSEFLLTEHNYYSEREEGILSISRRDTLGNTCLPLIKMFIRRDREQWGSPFHLRENTGGIVAQSGLNLPAQTVSFRLSAGLSDMSYPGVSTHDELWAEASITDSLRSQFGLLEAWLGVHRESGWDKGKENDIGIAPNASLLVTSPASRGVSIHAGTAYIETFLPYAWRSGSYALETRPLLIDSTFSDILRTYSGGNLRSSDVDRFLASQIGLNYSHGGARLGLDGILISQPGDFSNQFAVDGDTIRMVRTRRIGSDSQFGLSAGGQIPILWGLRLDTWWFRQSEMDNFSKTVDWRGYSRLYLERAFFSAPLIVRSHISFEQIGERRAFSDLGSYTLGPSNIIGFRLSATIRGVTLIWGTENFFKEHYAFIPGYRMIAKEEYIAFIWRLWL